MVDVAKVDALLERARREGFKEGVAREREEVQAHAPLYLEWVKEGALSADDALERLVIWLRARSAKGE